MNDFLRSTKFKVILVVVLLLIGLMIRTAVSGGLATALSVIISPFQKLSSAISNSVYGFAEQISEYGTLKEENAALQSQVSELQTQLADYYDVKRENEQLRAAYNLHEENPDFQLQTANIISRDSGQWFSSFTIDKGSADGIELQDAVLTSGSVLVGKVTEVYAYSAVVTTLLDPSVPVSVTISETGDAGLTEGDLSLIPSGQFNITYLSPDCTAAAGDIAVTTGRGGVYPKNLKVGTVLSISTDSSGASLIAKCSTLVAYTNLKDILVLTDFSGKDVSFSSGSGGS